MTIADFIRQSEAIAARAEASRLLNAWKRQQGRKVERREGAAQIKEGVQS